MKKAFLSVSALFLLTVVLTGCQQNNPTDPISAPAPMLENGQAPFIIQPASATVQAPGDSFVFFPGPVGIGTSDAGGYKLYVDGGANNGVCVNSRGTFGLRVTGGTYGGNFRATAAGGAGLYSFGDGYGGYLVASGQNGIGAYASGQECGIYAASPNCAGRFDGNVKVKGTVTADNVEADGVSLLELIKEFKILKEENEKLKLRISALETAKPFASR